MLRYCTVFEWTAEQPYFICSHIATELTAAYVLGLSWEFTVRLFLGRALVLNYVKNGSNLLFEDPFGIFQRPFWF